MVIRANDSDEELAHAGSAPTMTDDDPTSADVLDELQTGSECVHITDPDEYLVWESEDDENWFVLEKTPSGTWYPNPRISHQEMAEALLGDAGNYTIKPIEQTIPNGRLSVDD